ncbi:MAG: hypothetical protein PF489_05465, partial [Salinivirgaceae bacterium]|nr:hypothetical protein [Salinivirgaceae bacterium]
MDAKYHKYFKAHPKVNDFWFTHDGLAFTDAKKAVAHQKTIKRAKGEPLHLNRHDYKALDQST